MNVKFFNRQLPVSWFKKSAEKNVKQQLADWFFTQAKEAVSEVSSEFNTEGRNMIESTARFLEDSDSSALDKFQEEYFSTSEVYSVSSDVEHLFKKHLAKMKKEFYSDPEVVELLGLED